MRVSITGRHMEMTDALKAYIENGLQKVKTHFDRVIDVDVVLSVEKHRHIAEVNLHANGIRVHGKETSSDMYASVDAVLDKLDKQIRKFKDRIRRHQPRSIKETRGYEHLIIEVLPEQTDGVAAVESHRVMEHKQVALKPMSVDEAVMQLELVEEPFLLFINPETKQTNLVYSRDDGTYGLIEPQQGTPEEN